ncbi:MAG TPA: PspC domain-containing protein [Bryobacteraceae bacterium]|nr:PspC domain-containing protein [Bryobacteraceae bacterium]
MYCTKCGLELAERDIFCSQCGAATSKAPMRVPRRLTRSLHDKKIAGVCSGFAHYMDVDVTAVRLIWLILIIFPVPMGLLAYLAAWIVMPREQPLPAGSLEPSRVY